MMKKYGAVPNESEAEFLLQGAPSQLLTSNNGQKNGDQRKNARFYTFLQVSMAMLLVIAAALGTTTYFHKDTVSNPSTSLDSEVTPADTSSTTLDAASSATSSSADRSFSQFSDSTRPKIDIEDAADIMVGDGSKSIFCITSNEYGELRPDYPWLSPYQTILFEPFKIMNVKVGGFQPSEGNQYKWVLHDWETSENVLDEKLTAVPVTQFTHKGTQNLKLIFSVLDAAGEVLQSKTFHVYTKYVKRELRKLTLSDREKFLDTAITLWKTSTAQGREKYGSLYTSVDTYVLEHAVASNDIMCDQFHEGSGFLTHHMALQASFDASLKAVDPSVVLPYWDFSIEGQSISDEGESPDRFLEISPFLSAAWFGASDEDGHIMNSRWKNTKFPNTDGQGRVKPNSFGIIRSYWNNNNDALITRMPFNVAGDVVQNKKIPSCATHFEVMNTTTLGAFQLLSPAFGHGPMHVQTGGVGGRVTEDLKAFRARWASVLQREYSDAELKEFGLTPSKIRVYDEKYPLLGYFNYKFVGEFFHIYRSLWRSHMCARDDTIQLLHCPETCSANTPVEECTCSIPALTSGETDWQNVYTCLIFNNAVREKFNTIYPEDFLKDLVYTTANTQVSEGEMLEAASPADPLFWMIHPAINRMEHAKRLNNIRQMGGVNFHKWSASEETWLEYSYYNFDAGVKKTFPDGNKCSGHAANDAVLPDALPLSDGFHQRVDSNSDGIITNFEFYTGTDPNDPDKMEYVFDNFDWSHCSAESILAGTDNDE